MQMENPKFKRSYAFNPYINLSTQSETYTVHQSDETIDQ